MKKVILTLLVSIVFFNSNFAQDSFDSYGQEHNLKLKAILLKVGKGVPNDQISEKITNISKELYGENVVNEALKLSVYKTSQQLFDAKLISLDLYNLMSMVEKKYEEVTNYKEAEILVNEMKAKIQSLKSDTDRVSFIQYLSTLKASSYFWDPIGLNGANMVTSNKICWKCVANADAMGAIRGPLTATIVSAFELGQQLGH